MNTSPKLLRLAGLWIVFSGILLVAFWIRIQGVGTIPDGQFTGNDPYLYYWQAQVDLVIGESATFRVGAL